MMMLYDDVVYEVMNFACLMNCTYGWTNCCMNIDEVCILMNCIYGLMNCCMNLAYLMNLYIILRCDDQTFGVHKREKSILVICVLFL